MKISKKQIFSGVILTLFSLLMLASSMPAVADNSLIDSQTGINEIGQVYGGNSPTDIRAIVAQIIYVVLGFLGVIFISLTVFAGFKYMTSGGSEEKIQESMSMLRNAVIGVIIVLLSWMITRVAVLVMGRVIMNNAVDPWTGL